MATLKNAIDSDFSYKRKKFKSDRNSKVGTNSVEDYQWCLQILLLTEIKAIVKAPIH